MQQPFTNSEAVKRCMLVPDAPLSSHIRYGPKPPYAVGKPRQRPYSAPNRNITSGNFSDAWRGPNYQDPRVPPAPRTYQSVMHHRTDDIIDIRSRTPIFSKRIESVYSRDHDVRCNTPLPPYHAMTDPHLYEYFERRFGAIQMAANRKRHSGRPLSASSVLSKSKKKKDEDVLYKVAVITGEKKGAGTSAKVYITMKGLKGKIPKTRLTKKAGSVKNSSKVAFRFTKGSPHLFKIRGPEIGDIKSIIMEMDGIKKEDAWYLQEVEITNVKRKKTWTFVCNNWLSLHHGDQQNARELFPNIASKTDYEIVTVTGDKPNAATNANVYITVEGRSGSTSKIHLKDYTKYNFRQNSSDSFKVRTNCVGPMRKIKIEHDNTGIGAGWYLERVVITDLQHPKWKYYFPCGQWLARDEGDGSICRYLIGSKDPFAIRKDSKYKVSVYTGNKRGAGTDANVYLNLFGENGQSGERKLDDAKNNFERNSTDEFLIKCPCLGRLTRIRIGHDNSGFGPGWFLDKVIVDDCDNNIVYEFPCGRWFADDEGDGALFRDLLPGIGATTSAGVPYIITTMTGDKRNAGTGARVFVIMTGGPKKESSGKIWLEGGKFERGRSDIFNINSVATMLSPLDSLEIGHDNSGVGPGWFLEQVIVYCPVTGIEQVFPCGKWLADDSEDKQIQRVLYEQKALRQKKEKRVQWYMWVKTSDDSLSGTDAQVYACLYGTKGKTDEVQLENKSDEFERGSVDEFQISVVDIGKPYKLRVFHDDSKMMSGWKLDQVEMENMATKERYLFKCGQWLAADEGDHSTVREMPAEGPLIKKPLAVVKYTVEVYTGKKSRAGTDANVFLCIFGELGDTGRRRLTHSSTNINKFEKGQCDIFEIEAVTLEKIKKIEIGHDGKGIGAGWYLEKMVIKRADKSKYDVSIDCNSWLASDEETGNIVKEFTVSGSQLLGKTSYNVYVKTGDVSRAGTDANVFLKIFGSKGDTGSLALVNSESSSNKFERNRTDHFIVEAEDIGKIKRIRIGHDGANFGSGWFLDEVRIDIPSRGEQYVFACHRWLDKSEGDGEIEIELEPSFKEDRERTIPYEVTVWTSDISSAGTDANVFIQMYGTEGKTDELTLNNRSDNFERGHQEKFKIEQKDIGELLKIRIGHDGKGWGAGWHLEKLLIQRRPKAGTKKSLGNRVKPPSAEERRQSLVQQMTHDYDIDSDSSSTSSSPTPRRKRSIRRKSELKTVEEEEEVYDGEETVDYWFFVNRWFATDEDDKQIVRELTPTDKNGKPLRRSLDDVEYIVRVYTGKTSGAGTDANVFVTLFGQFKNNPIDSGERQLKESSTNMNKFESGQEDIFKITAVELGSLTKCRVRHDNSGLGAAWFLDRIEVEDTKNKKTFYFLCQRWLATGKDDGQICRELVPVDKSVLKKLERKDSARMEVALETKAHLTTYHVHVITGTEFGSGTNANVYIKLYGDKDQTEKIPLKSSLTYSDKFESGHDDEFILEVVNIGELQKIVIGHDDSGFRSDWFLDKVVIDSPSLGKSWTFPCNRWLAKGKDDNRLERELFPQELETEEYTPCIPYEIKTYTSNKSGADTSADVYVQLFGKDMTCTQQKSLCTKNERPSKFKKGACDVFVLELEDVGDLTKMRIGHDNAGMFAGWHLEKVEIRTLGAQGKGSTLYVFPCNRWLARDEDDKEIVRELVPDKIIKEKIRKDGEVEKKEVKVRNQLQMKQYIVNVHTGDVFGAGTDANVFINIYGDLGNTGERKLANSETHMDKFERNNTDVFKLEAADLGSVYKVKIHHDNKSFSPSWFLDYVEVIDVMDNKKSYMFHCERWLSKKKDDCKIDRTLYVKGYDGDMGSSTGTLKSTRFGGSVASLESAKSGDPFSKSPRVKRKQLMQEEEMDNLSNLEQIPYSVKVWTGSGDDNGTDANVWIQIIGPKKLHSGTQFLEFAQNDKFEPGSVNTFSFDAPDVTEVKKIKVGHDGSAPGSGWFVKQISIDMPTKGKNYMFTCNQWLARDKTDGKTERIFSLDEGLSSVTSYRPKCSYECTVVTGDVAEAGTDMKITLTAFGDKGTTTPMELDKASDRFERAREDTLRFELEDVGALKKIRVELSGKGSRPDWFLERIDLFNFSTGVKYKFECNQWFGKKSPDKKFWRDIPAIKRGKEVISRTTYKISVKTSNVPGAGTDANVFVILFGSNGDTGELHLKKSETYKDPFENDQIDVFTFSDILSIGEMSKCRVWHDNKGFGAAWHLEYIEVEDLSTKKKFTFHCGRWFSKKDDDKQILRELTCAPRPLTPGSDDEIVYDIEVKTADKDKASTVHNGWLIIKGKKGETKMKMKNSARDKILRRGDTNNFQHSCRSLGKIKEVIVGAYEREDKPLQDLEGKDAMWYCYQVAVTDTSTGDKYVFPCKDWIEIGTSAYKKSQGKTLQLKDLEQSQVSVVRSLASVKYQVVVYTGDVFGAGTNANVCITIFGANGDSGKRALEQSWRDLFERNQIDKFEIECLDLGELEKIKIEHDNKNFRPAWYLEKVEIINLGTNEKKTFPCSQWLDKDRGDGAIARELLPVD